MKQPRRRPAPTRMEYAAALRMMFRGSRLTKTNGEQTEYSVDGGPVTDRAARELLNHALCRPCDIGLIADTPQSWRFDSPDN